MDLRPLTDDAVLARIEALVSQERENIVDIVEHLAELDRREVVADHGYSTLFDYCRRKLRYSEAAAFLRIRAARAANHFPRILADLRSGAIHLDAVMRLYPYLSPNNSDQVLNQAAGATKREVLALVAQFDPAQTAVERDVIRHLPVRAATTPDVSLPSPAPILDSDSQSHEASVVVPPPRVRLAFTADDDFLVLLERLKSLRRHKFPSGRLEELLKDAVESLLDRIDPDRRAQGCAGTVGENRRGAGAFRRRSKRRFGNGTAGAAPMLLRTAAAAKAATSWNTTTSCRGPWAAAPIWPPMPVFCAGRTTKDWRGGASALEGGLKISTPCPPARIDRAALFL